MYNDSVKVWDVHGHVSHPFGGMGQVLMFLQAVNSDLTTFLGSNKVIGGPAAERMGLGEEAFAVTVGNHVKQLDTRNIDKQVVGPRPFLMLGQMGPDILPDWTRLVNDAIHTQCEMFPERFLGACQLPENVHADDASHCLPELRRCVDEYGFCGVYVSPDPEGKRNAPGLADAWWDPLYEECQRRGLPIIVHGTNCQDPRFRVVPNNYQLGFVAEQYFANQILSHSDVFERFPELKVIICHCGGALDRWIPTDPHLSQKDLSNNLFYDTCAHDHNFLECAIKQRGPQRLCFGSEVPGSGGAIRPENGRPADDLVPIIGGFEFINAADKQAIFQDNPQRLFPRFAP